MQFSKRTILLLSTILSGVVSANPMTPKRLAAVDCLPFNFAKLFTATLNLGSPSKYIPIPAAS